MSEAAGSRAAALVGVGILLSRVVGLLRNFLFASYFGLGAVADAYNAAFKIPNTVRNLLGEGTLSAAFVPVYSRFLERGDARASRALANAVLGILMLAVSVLTIAGIIAAPLLTTLLTPGFSGEQREITIRLTRVLFPMTAVMVLSGWCLGVQNSHRRFFWSYASAVMWSAAQIALLLVGGSRASDLTELALWLAWATLAGALLQVAAQVPEVLRLVGPVRPTLRASADGVRSVLRNVLPVVTALGVTQISSFVDLSVASFLPEGSVTSLTQANIIAMLPVSVFGISVAASSLPDLSRDGEASNYDALRERIRAGWQRILFYIVPSAAACIALGDYIVGTLYRAGRFGAAEQRTVHWVLAGYAVGLISFGSVKLMSSAFHALQDYRTPLRASIASILVSAAGAVGFAFFLRSTSYAAAGIALGAALGSYTNLVLLLRGLRSRIGALYTPAMWIGTRRIGMATAVAVVVGLALRTLQHQSFPALHPRVAGPVVLIAFGGTYIVVSWLMGSAEAARWLRRKPRGVPPASGSSGNSAA